MELAFAIAECVVALAMWLIAFHSYRTTGSMNARVMMWLSLAGVLVVAVIVPNLAAELLDMGKIVRAALILFATAALFLLGTWFLVGGLRPEGAPLPGQRVER